MSETDTLKEWLNIAEHDLETAKVINLHLPEFIDIITFHCQQAIEKYLKAYLIFLGINFKFSHDLVYLLDLVSEKDNKFKSYYEIFSEIQNYAVEIRYPNKKIFPTKEKVEIAIQAAEEIREIVQKIVKDY